MSRAEKVYENSPTMKRGEDGKMGVSKPAPKAKGPDAEVAGTAGFDVYKKEAQERLDLFLSHEKAHFDRATTSAGDAASGGESTGSGAGKDKIKKVEKGDK